MADNAEQEPEKKTRRQPSKISRLMENTDPRIAKRAHLDYYGFEPSDKYISDLAAYVHNPTKTPHMLATGDAQQVMDTIREVYDVRVSRAYADDLLAFSEKHGKDEGSE